MPRLLVLFVASWLCASMLLADEPQIVLPEEILADLRPEHPRLMATAADFQQLRQLCTANDSARQWLAQLQQEANTLVDLPPVKHEIPDGKRLLAVSRAAKERALLLGLMYGLTDDRRYAERLWRELDTVTRFKDWNPSHFLDTAEMTFAVAIGYDWLHGTWTSAQRQQLREAIVRLGLEPGLPTYRQQTWWARAVHNWNQVCNGGLAVGALAIAEDEPAVSREVLRAALNSLPRAMHEFRPDGGWGEGPGYWDYATEYNVYVLAALRTALGSDYGLAELPGFRQTGDFPLYFTSPIGQTFNYADARSTWRGAPQLFWLATAFNQPAWAARQREWADDRPTPLDLLWGGPWFARTERSAAPPLDRHFAGVSVVFLRGAWDDPESTFVGFKGGNNRVNHGHLDLGTFVVDMLGERWLVDLGPDNYNLPGYFGPRRWNFYRCRAEGHNTLVLNPGSGPDQDLHATAAITHFQSQRDRASAIADLTAAYSGSASQVRRGVALLERRDVLVQDELSASGSADIWWFAHTRAAVTLTPDGRAATLQQNGKTVHVKLLEPTGAAFTVSAAEPFPSSPHVEGQADESRGATPARKLSIHLAGQEAARLAVLVSPSPEATAVVQPLDRW